MDIQLLLSAAAAGKDAVTAFRDNRRWTGLRHVGRGLVDLGTFGEGLKPLPAGDDSKPELVEPGMLFERLLAENGNDAVKAAEVAFDKIEILAGNYSTASARAAATGIDDTSPAVAGFLKNRPIIMALAQAALNALLAALPKLIG